MKSFLIVVHSRTGAARQLAAAACAAAREADGARPLLLDAGDARPAHLLACDGYLFCCPENLASMSGEMKAFFDRCYYPALGRIEGRPYGCVIAAGSDGQGAARQIQRIATGWRLRLVAEPLIICTQAQSAAEIAAAKTLAPGQLQAAAALGAALAAGIGDGVF